jgi:hypothetical protein
VDLPASTFGRAGSDVAAERGCALGHAAQPVSCGARRPQRRSGRPVVADIDVQHIRFDAERHVGVRGSGVAHDVGQRLLDDPEAGLFDRDRDEMVAELDVGFGVEARGLRAPE